MRNSAVHANNVHDWWRCKKLVDSRYLIILQLRYDNKLKVASYNLQRTRIYNCVQEDNVFVARHIIIFSENIFK